MRKTGPAGPGERKIRLPERTVMRAVKGVKEVEATKAPRFHLRAELGKEQVAKTHAVIVRLDHRHRRVGEHVRPSRQNLLLKAVGVEFEEKRGAQRMGAGQFIQNQSGIVWLGQMGK